MYGHFKNIIKLEKKIIFDSNTQLFDYQKLNINLNQINCYLN